jgi:hypothetical protein
MNPRYYDLLDKIELIEAVDPYFQNRGNVAFYRKAAEILSTAAGRKTAWTWRYVQGFIKGTIAPGDKFTQAVYKTIEAHRATTKQPRTPAPKIGRDAGWIEYWMRK